MADEPTSQQLLAEGIQRALQAVKNDRDAQGLVTRWAVIAEVATEDDRVLWLHASEGTKTWEVKGLLLEAMLVEIHDAWGGGG